MKQELMDFAGLGILLWLFGYIGSLVLFFSPFVDMMGWILTVVFAPVTVLITWWWFRNREFPLSYYVRVGLAWTAIAIILDYLFIVQLFQATYYGPDVILYYVLTFVIPVAVGCYLAATRENKVAL